MAIFRKARSFLLLTGCVRLPGQDGVLPGYPANPAPALIARYAPMPSRISPRMILTAFPPPLWLLFPMFLPSMLLFADVRAGSGLIIPDCAGSGKGFLFFGVRRGVIRLPCFSYIPHRVPHPYSYFEWLDMSSIRHGQPPPTPYSRRHHRPRLKPPPSPGSAAPLPPADPIRPR